MYEAFCFSEALAGLRLYEENDVWLSMTHNATSFY
jgi:hypothetical protein